MPEGKEIGKAYVTVNLNDQTDADYEKIRAAIEKRAAISIGTTLAGPDGRDFDRIKADVEGKPALNLATSLKLPDSKGFELIKADVEGKAALNLATALKLPDAGDYQKIKDVTEAKGPIKLGVELDKDKAEQGLKSLGDSADTQSNRAKSSVGGMLSATTAAWVALGTLVAGPAVALGLGAVATGFLAIGIAAEKSSPQVQQAFNTMKTTGLDVFQNSFQSLTPVIVGSLNQWTSGIRALGPQFEQTSSAVAPGLAIISAALLKAAQTDMPAFNAALNQATPLARSLAGGIQDVANGFAAFLGRLNFTEASQGLSALLRDVGQLLPALANLVNAVMPFSNALLSSAIPAALSFVAHLANDLAPAIRLIGSAIQALAPVLNFMSGPTAAVLAGVVAFKALEGATNGLLPVFNKVSSAVSDYGNKIVSMAGGSDSAIGSFNLMTEAGKKQAVQAATSALATAQQASAQATSNLATLESAAAADASSVSQAQLTAARTAATVATTAETEATAALNTATAATSFAFGPLGIAVGAVVGVMGLLGVSQSKAGDSANSQAQAEQTLIGALRQSKGAIDDNVRATEAQTLANTTVGDSGESLLAYAKGLGLSLPQVTDAALGNAAAMGAIKSQLQGQVSAGKEAQDTVDTFTNALQGQADAAGKAKDTLAAEAAATSQSSATSAAAVQLTAEQQTAASQVAKMFGLSITDVTAAFRNLPGAGSTAAGAVGQVTSAFITGEVAVKNAEQSLSDYLTGLQTNATKANEALSNANHSYQQSIAGVADAQHSYEQAQRGVADANQGVVTAQRAVTDAVNAYGQAQHAVGQAQQAVADANQGVINSERSLAQAQLSEQQAQVALTQARHDAVEQLKALQLQLNDQVASEQQARLRLFEQTQTAAAQGITPGNTDAILAAPITQSNVAQKQAALDLVNAENALADTLNTGATLREKVNTANQQGVDNNPAVVSAAQALKNAQDQVGSSELAVAAAHRAVDNAVYSLNQSYDNLGKAQQAIVAAREGVVKAQQAVTDAVYSENRARAAVKDAIYQQQQALIAVRDAQDQAKRANDLNTTSLDLNTQAGRNNWAQLQTLFNAMPAWMDQNQRYNAMIQDTAKFFGGSTQAAADFLKQENLIPKDFRFGLTAMAQANFDELNRTYNDKFGGRIGPVAANVAHAMAEGGHVRGPGGPRDDAINAKLSDNEYVQPADAVDHYGVGFMEAVRTKQYPKGGDGAALPGFASGGLYQGEALNYFLSGAGTAYQTAVNVLGTMGFPHPTGLPAYVPPPPDVGGGVNLSGINGSNRDIVLQVWKQFGWTDAAEIAATDYLLMRESGYRNTAQNPTSTAFGMFQFLDSTWGGYGIPKTADPGLQSVAGGRYISSRYGDPIGAAAHERAYNWYDNGGYMLNQPGVNNTGKPEMVLPPDLTETLNAINEAFQSGRAGGSSGPSITNHIATVAMNPREVAEITSRELAWALR